MKMEMNHRGLEGESLLRPDQRPIVMPHNSTRPNGWESNEAEKTPFLRNEPVKLTPAWEGSNLPNDTLNLKGVTMDLVPPKDKWNLIYMTLILHGLGTLTSWNMFITAKNYFVEYKLANADPYYAAHFLTFLGIAAQIPNFLFSWFNVFARIGGNLTTRIVWSLSAEVVIFVITIALAMADTSGNPVLFFWITLVLAFLINTFNAVFQNSVYGVAGRLPPKYTGAVVLGSNVCGTVVSLLNWVTDVFSKNQRTSAIYYFVAGIFVMLVCFDTYFALPLNRFYRYHASVEQQTTNTVGDANQDLNKRPPYLKILKQSWVQLYNIFITFFVTLSVFPAIHTEIKPIQKGFLGDDFMRITCFITFNVMAMTGSLTASVISFPKPKWLVIFTTLRFAFIPLYLFCNYQPTNVTRTLPVLITNDWAYWAIAVLMGWTSGHFSTLGMMYVGRKVDHENSTTIGMIAGATLVSGIVFGVIFAELGPIVVSMSLWKNM